MAAILIQSAHGGVTSITGAGTSPLSVTCTSFFASPTTLGNTLLHVAWIAGTSTASSPGIQVSSPTAGTSVFSNLGGSANFPVLSPQFGAYEIYELYSATAIATTVPVLSTFVLSPANFLAMECSLYEFSGIVSAQNLGGSGFHGSSSVASHAANMTFSAALGIMPLLATGTQVAAGAPYQLGVLATSVAITASSLGEAQYDTYVPNGVQTATYGGTSSAWLTGLYFLPIAASVTAVTTFCPEPLLFGF